MARLSRRCQAPLIGNPIATINGATPTIATMRSGADTVELFIRGPLGAKFDVCQHNTMASLLRQIRANQVCGLSKLPGRHSNSLSTLCISARIVLCTTSASGAIECCELRRADTPITTFLPRHNMEMEVRRFLSAEDPVVLKRKYSQGTISPDERLCNPPGRDHYRLALLIRKIEQRRDVPACDNATLADFELPRIDHGECLFVFIHDRPPFFATRHPFTKVARVSFGKLEQLAPPVQLASRPCAVLSL